MHAAGREMPIEQTVEADASARADTLLSMLGVALLEAGNLKAVSVAVRRFASACVADARVALLWGLAANNGLPTRLRCTPRTARIWADLEVGQAAYAAGAATHIEKAGRSLWSWPLPLTESGVAVLQIQSSAGEESYSRARAQLARGIALVARRVSDLLQIRRLERSVRKSERSVLLQRSLYAISDVASGESDRTEMLRAVHQIVGNLMYAENFFIALYDRPQRILRFIYFADVKDYDWPEPHEEFHEDNLVGSLTMAVIHRGQALIGPSAEIVAQLELEYDEARGPDSEDWLGVPMIANGEVLGAIVVQSYDKSQRYSESDRALLTYVAQHILTAITRRRAQEELEAEVSLRTRELAAANVRLGSTNRELLQEVQDRQTGERLQAALFRIAELTSSTNSMYEFFAAVHGVVSELLYAKNFFIALLVDEGRAFEFPYAVDEHDSGVFFEKRKLRRGLTEYLLRTGKPLLVSREQIDELSAAGEMQTLGAPSVCWLGVPLMQNGVALGAIVLQSYSQQVIYSTRDQELLTFVGFHIATALQRRRAQDSLKLAYSELEIRVVELHRAQNELIEIEKMASLGRLVAGVAHEVNTPLGIGVTAISFLRGQLAAVRAALPAAQSDRLLGPVESAAAMAEVNLHRAANLVRTFKQVAVDQSTSHIRTVRVREYLEGAVLSLSPLLRNGGHQVSLECADSVELTSRPDALYQIMVNLITNSLAHGYPDGLKGKLTIKVEVETPRRLHISYQDDGIGMDNEVASHMFEPFYTTRRDQGGTGLGMHIVFNLVTQALGGKISCETQPGAGVRFDMMIPSVHPQGGSLHEPRA